MSRCILNILATVGSAASVATDASAQTFHALVLAPGAPTEMMALSGDGRSAVVREFEPSPTDHGMLQLWTPEHGLEVLTPGSLDYSNGAYPLISRDGSVIVSQADFANGSSAFRWTRATGAVPIVGITPYAMSRDGLVVWGQMPEEPCQLARWTPSVGIEYFGNPRGQLFFNVGAASADGAMVIGCYLDSGEDASYLFRYSDEALFEYQGRPDGSSLVYATAASFDASVIGGYAEYTLPPTGRAVRVDGEMDILTPPIEGDSSIVLSMSADGSVIGGYYYFGYDQTDSHPFIWTVVGGSEDVQAILSRRGVDLSGWTLSNVVGLSEDGTIAAGNGMHNGIHSAWIARISGCGDADFDHDGNAATDADIEAFFRCLAGTCCPTCDSADFDADGDVATDADIEAFFRVLVGQDC